jgi:hypothetical protein
MVLMAGSGLLLPQIYTIYNGRARDKQELKRGDCQNPLPQWNSIRIILFERPFKNIILNIIPDVV